MTTGDKQLQNLCEKLSSSFKTTKCCEGKLGFSILHRIGVGFVALRHWTLAANFPAMRHGRSSVSSGIEMVALHNGYNIC